MPSTERLAALTGILLLTSACARHAPLAGATPDPPAALCTRQVLRRADLAGILQQPLVREQEVPADPQSCRFSTQGFASITLSVRAGTGRATLNAWRQGRVPLATTPLRDVGDDALWQDSLHELIARQDDLLCDVQVSGSGADLALSAAALPARLAQLCRQIFARA